jgi:hypothetical protein
MFQIIPSAAQRRKTRKIFELVDETANDEPRFEKQEDGRGKKTFDRSITVNLGL